MKHPALNFLGAPITIEFRPALRVHRGQLFCGGNSGTEVHAGSFLRERRIVLDSALLRNAAERDRILAHEIFHFVWWKLGHPRRASYKRLLADELKNGIGGEMGWSAEARKIRLSQLQISQRRRVFREYACESFCDTAAAYLLGIRSHDEIALPVRARRVRMAWLRQNVDLAALRI